MGREGMGGWMEGEERGWSEGRWGSMRRRWWWSWWWRPWRKEGPSITPPFQTDRRKLAIFSLAVVSVNLVKIWGEGPVQF